MTRSRAPGRQCGPRGLADHRSRRRSRDRGGSRRSARSAGAARLVHEDAGAHRGADQRDDFLRHAHRRAKARRRLTGASSAAATRACAMRCARPKRWRSRATSTSRRGPAAVTGAARWRPDRARPAGDAIARADVARRDGARGHADQLRSRLLTALSRVVRDPAAVHLDAASAARGARRAARLGGLWHIERVRAERRRGAGEDGHRGRAGRRRAGPRDRRLARRSPDPRHRPRRAGRGRDGRR